MPSYLLTLPEQVDSTGSGGWILTGGMPQPGVLNHWTGFIHY